jgi:hypothetical protein
VNFIRRDDFLRFLRSHGEAMFRVAQHVGREYQSACRELNSLGLTHSAAAKMAKLLLGWQDVRLNGNGHSSIKLTLTHEEMAQMIGASRETVTRILARFRNHDYIEIQGATLFIRNRAGLQSIADNHSERHTSFAASRRRFGHTAHPPLPDVQPASPLRRSEASKSPVSREETSST